MMKVSLSVATFAVVSVYQASAHSWVRSLNGGIQRGGLFASDDMDTHYFCPTANLADCQPNANTNIMMTAINQLPCTGITTPSNPMGQVTAGGDMKIDWPSNGHQQVTGTCVDIFIAPFMASPTMSDFTQIGFCLPYGELEANLTLAASTAAGQYTIFWKWNFGSFWFTSCVDIQVTAGSGSSSGGSSGSGTSKNSTTVAPTTTTTTAAPATKSLRTTVKPSAQPTTAPRTSAGKSYQKQGCAGNDVPTDFCQLAFGQGSFCKSNQDPCGRQQCDGDSNANLGPCFDNRLLL